MLINSHAANPRRTFDFIDRPIEKKKKKKKKKKKHKKTFAQRFSTNFKRVYSVLLGYKWRRMCDLNPARAY